MTLEYSVFENISPSDPTWAEFRHLVEAEGWAGDDHSVMTLTPTADTTRTVVAKDSEGRFIGSVVWNEYDDVAFLGFYLLKEEHRGNGIGSVIWKRAMERISKEKTIILRSVPYMAPRYKLSATPFEGPSLNGYNADWKTLVDGFQPFIKQGADVRPVNELSAEEYIRLERFDKEVTGRDRSKFLKSFYALDFTRGSAMFNTAGAVVACAAITTTSTPERHLFKLAPIYASSLEDALTVSLPLIKYAASVDSEARILVQIIDGSEGDRLLVPLLNSFLIERKQSGSGITLCSTDYRNPVDMTRLFSANNNTIHCDA